MCKNKLHVCVSVFDFIQLHEVIAEVFFISHIPLILFNIFVDDDAS